MNNPPAFLPMPAVALTASAFLIAAGPHMMAMPAWLGLIILALVGWRLAAVHWRWPQPPAWIRVPLTLVAIALVVLAFGGLWGRRAATTLLSLMLAVKMLELFRIRDLRMVVSVCFFLIATQFLFNERLIYLVYLIVGSLVAVAALIHIHHLDERGQLDDGYEAPPAMLPVFRQAAVMLAIALPIAVTLFLLFPRLATPLWGLPDEVMDGRTGLSDTMSPGSIANLIPDDSPAFRAEFSGSPPPHHQRYWRGPVFWSFDGDTWRHHEFLLHQSAAPVPDAPLSLSYRIQLEPHERRWLFALDYPVETPEDAHLAMDFQMVSKRPITTLTRYEISSNPDFVDTPELNYIQQRLALRLPEDRNPRSLEFARQMREHHADDRELIDAVLNLFRTEEFYYRLETTPTGRHGTDEFLFDLRVGFCEHYASAFAVLMRAAGIPARIVTGYQGGFWQAGGQYLLVRHSDAHAWVEVWLEGDGWTRVDPTAAVSPTRISLGSRSAIDESRHLLDLDWIIHLRNRYDRIQHLWNNWVLGFDAARQLTLLERIGLPEMTPLRIGLAMVMVLAVVVLGMALFVLGRAPVREADPLLIAWMKLQRRLRRRGIDRRIGETPTEFIERAIEELETDRHELTAIGRLYERARYGDDQRAREEFISQATAWRPDSAGEPQGSVAV